MLADDVVRARLSRPVGVEALDVGEHDELLGAERDGERGRGGVGVDVVDLAVRRRAATLETTGIRPSASRPCTTPGVDRDDVADQADVDLLAVDRRGACGSAVNRLRVLAGQADRERAVRVDQADDLALHLADEHHPDDVHRLGGGDPQPACELAGDAEPVEHAR